MIRLGWEIDSFVAKFGLRFICFSAYKHPPQELDYLKTNVPMLHLPDLTGGVRCIFCGRMKRFHLANKIKL